MMPRPARQSRSMDGNRQRDENAGRKQHGAQRSDATGRGGMTAEGSALFCFTRSRSSNTGNHEIVPGQECDPVGTFERELVFESASTATLEVGLEPLSFALG